MSEFSKSRWSFVYIAHAFLPKYPIRQVAYYTLQPSGSRIRKQAQNPQDHGHIFNAKITSGGFS